MRIFTRFLVFSCLSLSLLGGNSAAEFQYFGEPVSVCFDSNIQKDLGNDINDQMIVSYFNTLEGHDYYCSFRDLFTAKKDLQLNDWFYYLLIKQTGEEIYGEDAHNYVTLFSWFFLAKSGYKVQINYNNEEVLLSVYTEDEVFDIPSKPHGEGWMVEVSSFQKEQESNMLVTIRSNFYFNIKGKSFSFELDELPTLTYGETFTRQIKFIHDSRPYLLETEVDLNLMYMMYQYPEVSILENGQIPLSKTAHNSLIPDLRHIINKLEEEEALRFLLSFTRQGSLYKVDGDIYQRQNVTFSPEESLFYEFSDCEDRSILFSYLTRELLGLNAILLDFGDHVGVAVQTSRSLGKPILFEGERYTYCEATDPKNELGLGQYPEILKDKTYRIITQ